MIPHKLELKNFLSYGSTLQTIDFKNYSLICLSGKNGNGKSALLDAITWAIWGQARKVSGSSKPDEGLVRLGQTSMMVSLEFEVNKQRYRVRREFSKTYSKNHVVVDFELYNSQQQHFISLTDKTIRDTQEKIISLIGLDFETFINTAFVRQGHSNEFSQKNPKDRKTILASILGLARFDRLKEQAQEKVKKFQEQHLLIDSFQKQREVEFEKEVGLVENKNLLEKQFAELSASLETIEQSLQKLDEHKTAFLSQEHLFRQQEADYSRQKEELEKGKEELLQLVAQWRTIHKKLLQIPHHGDLEQKLKAAQNDYETYTKLYEESLKLQEQIIHAKENYHRLLRAVQDEFHKTLSQEKEELARLQNDYSLHSLLIAKEQEQQKKSQEKVAMYERDIAECVKHLSSYEAFKNEMIERLARFEKRRDAYHRFTQYGNRIISELKESDHRKHLLENQDNPSCPTCEQVVTIRRKQFLLDRFSQKDSLLRHQEKRLRIVLSRLKGILLQDHEAKVQLQKQEERFKHYLLKQETVLKAKQECEKEMADRVALIKSHQERKELFERAIKALEASLQKRTSDFETLYINTPSLKEAQEKIAQLEARKKEIAYSSEKHAMLKQIFAALEKEYSFIKDRDKEIALQETRKARINEFIQSLKKIKLDLHAFEAKRRAYSLLKTDHEKKEKERVEYSARKNEHSIQKEMLIKEKARLEHEESRLKTLREEHAQNCIVATNLQKEMSEYSMLASLFGKDGIQAVLIEESLPEIEYEANSLLSRLSDNNAQITIDSVRDLKKGGVRETLDIKISDASGIRPYELFSGGEAFRIDFALRIAISKLLARRAGTSLQTLIIDEGFGSQDEEGLSRLMDAIYTIQDDFERIIIVSHLPVFKDNFPVHFVIEKSPLGSHVHVHERG